MEISRLNEYYKQHLIDEFSSFNTEGFNISIEWEMDFQKSKDIENNVFLDEKTLYFVLTKLPSTNFQGILIQSIMISCLCEQKALPHAMAILENYQKKVITSKKWFENVMFTESFTSPNVSQNYLAIDVAYGVEINMSGTILFNEDVSDIEKIEIESQEIPFINALETLSFTQVATDTIQSNEEYTYLAEAINKSTVYKIDIKFIDKIGLSICDYIRAIKNKTKHSNQLLTVKITESSGFVSERKMLLVAFAKSSGRTEAPIISITLTDGSAILGE